jgi:hypothetical protein
MPDYSKGKIYTIRNKNDDTKIYVGSTIQSLAVRFGGHKADSQREKCMNMKIYKEINNDWTNWYIELYENYSCSNREELCKREGEVIRLIGTLNNRIENRSKKEYRDDNKEKAKEQRKQYLVKNADKIKEYSKNYQKQLYDINIEKKKEKVSCECGCLIRKDKLTIHKKSKKHIEKLSI